MQYIHEYDSKGNHRLGTCAIKNPIVFKWGEWVNYQSAAMLGQYCAVTDYYTESNEFPDCTILYKIISNVWPLETKYPE